MKQNSFKRMATLLFKHPLRLSSILIVTIGQVLLSVYLPVIVGQAIDQALFLEWSKMMLLLKQMAIVIILSAIVQWLLPSLVNQLVYRMIADLRKQLYNKFHSLPLSYLDKQSVGDWLSHFSGDMEQLTNGLLMIFNQFFLGVLTILASLVTMAGLDLGMMLLVVVLTPLSLLLAHYIAQKSYDYYQKQTMTRGRQAQTLEETIRQLTLIQSFNAQEQMIERFNGENKEYAHYSQAALFSSSTVNPTTRFINALIYTLLAGFGAWRIMVGQLTVGELTTFLQYANQYSKPFNDISSVLSELQSALACADRLFNVLGQADQTDGKGKSLGCEEIRGQVEFKNVSFRYQADKPLIENFNLFVPAGSKVAIVGPTGAGKSTLINLLMRFYDVDKGHILIDGQDINDVNKEELRRQVGMVLQETWIKSGTIHDNIAYGHPEVDREIVRQAARAAKAEYFIEQLPNGYDSFLAGEASNLSQGQSQLLSIARVFVDIPRILILDEATSSIDTRTELLVQEAFAKLMQGRTSFIIAHRLSTIQSADIILVMVDGQIVEKGNHEQLMQAKGTYYRMQQTQVFE